MSRIRATAAAAAAVEHLERVIDDNGQAPAMDRGRLTYIVTDVADELLRVAHTLDPDGEQQTIDRLSIELAAWALAMVRDHHSDISKKAEAPLTERPRWSLETQVRLYSDALHKLQAKTRQLQDTFTAQEKRLSHLSKENEQLKYCIYDLRNALQVVRDELDDDVQRAETGRILAETKIQGGSDE